MRGNTCRLPNKVRLFATFTKRLIKTGKIPAQINTHARVCLHATLKLLKSWHALYANAIVQC